MPLTRMWAVSLSRAIKVLLISRRRIQGGAINMYKILENRENRLNFRERMFIGCSRRGGRVVEGAPLLRE